MLGRPAVLLERFRDWAAGQPGVLALALVGSHARGEAIAGSDLDLVMLVDDPARFVDSDDWIGELGAVALVRTRQWGVLTERRLRMPDGLEVDVGVVAPAWAAVDPVDEGTARVVRDGMVALHDPYGLLAALAEAVAAR